ncbi:hypothetical protein [Methylobacter sp.]|uniref:hypothetical protein n=1 Tax=Methylobacter sp. TaxID=2051955 RepID=UPI002FDE686D
MTISQQKDIELAQLKKAFKLIGITSYEVVDKDKESPDFIVNIDGQSVGVEVTEVYRDLGIYNSAKTESDLTFIVEKAIKIYNEKGGEPFVFGVGFNGNVTVEKRKIVYRGLGEFLYDQSKLFLIDRLYEIHNIIPDKNKYPSLHMINSIVAQRTDSVNAVGFTVSSFDSIQVERCALESAIQKKVILLPKYRQRCEIIWLLITLPSMKLTGNFILPDTEFTCQYNDFNAMYVLDEYRNKIQCINQT